MRRIVTVTVLAVVLSLVSASTADAKLFEGFLYPEAGLMYCMFDWIWGM